MKRLTLLLIGFAALLSAQPATVNVSQTLYKADGTPYQGTVAVSWQQFDSADGFHIPAGTKIVKLTNTGLLSANLVPNIGASPTGTSYTVTYKLDLGDSRQVSWVVPASGPVTVTSIETSVLVGPSATISSSQLPSPLISQSYLQALTGSVYLGTTDYLSFGHLANSWSLTDNTQNWLRMNVSTVGSMAGILAVPTGAGICWGSADAGTSPTLCFARNGSSIAELNNGTLGSFVDLKLRNAITTSSQTTATAVSGLPTCNSGAEGTRRAVTDSNAASFAAGIGAVVAGGGSTHVPVFCDGTSWRIG